MTRSRRSGHNMNNNNPEIKNRNTSFLVSLGQNYIFSMSTGRLVKQDDERPQLKALYTGIAIFSNKSGQTIYNPTIIRIIPTKTDSCVFCVLPPAR